MISKLLRRAKDAGIKDLLDVDVLRYYLVPEISTMLLSLRRRRKND